MVEFTKQWVVNIVALVLFIVLFEILLPTGKMKKYVNLVTGTILIIAIITPLTGLIGKGEDLLNFQMIGSNTLDRLQVEKDKRLLEEEQMKQIVEVYRLKIVDQLEQKALEVEGVEEAKADVIINEDYNSDRFGEILRAYIGVKTDIPGKGSPGTSQSDTEAANDSGTDGKVVETAGKPVKEVKRIIIGKDTGRQTEMEDCSPAIKKKLEEKLCALYGISPENIVISRKQR